MDNKRKTLVATTDTNGRRLELIQAAFPDILLLHIYENPSRPMQVTIFLLEPVAAEQIAEQLRTWLNAEE